MELNDRIRGAVVGLAYGDALGLGAEFMTQHEVGAYYPDGLRRFDQMVRDAHRMAWKRGEYTNETLLTSLMLESVVESDGFVPYNLCKKFQAWYAEEERDIPPVLRLFCNNSEWLENPIPVAHRVWHSSRVCEASNETLHRALVTGLTSEDDHLNEHTRKFVLLTHDDSRCVASTMVTARVIRGILREKEDNIDNLMRLCSQIDNRTKPFLQMAWEGDIEGIKPDDSDTQTWTRKGMATALWGYWHHDNAPDMIHSVIDRGGDANTNACIAGAMAGLKFGYEALPEEKEKIKGLDYLIDLSDKVAELTDRKVFG